MQVPGGKENARMDVEGDRVEADGIQSARLFPSPPSVCAVTPPLLAAAIYAKNNPSGSCIRRRYRDRCSHRRLPHSLIDPMPSPLRHS
jgi:hypothetical protein